MPCLTLLLIGDGDEEVCEGPSLPPAGQPAAAAASVAANARPAAEQHWQREFVCFLTVPHHFFCRICVLFYILAMLTNLIPLQHKIHLRLMNVQNFTFLYTKILLPTLNSVDLFIGHLTCMIIDVTGTLYETQETIISKDVKTALFSNCFCVFPSW
jgi:hypothetical protein